MGRSGDREKKIKIDMKIGRWGDRGNKIEIKIG